MIHPGKCEKRGNFGPIILTMNARKIEHWNKLQDLRLTGSGIKFLPLTYECSVNFNDGRQKNIDKASQVWN